MSFHSHTQTSTQLEINYEEVFTKDELQRLDEEFGRIKNACYLDHSGATLYAKSQIDSTHLELQSNLFSNPHSRNPSSSITTDAIDYIRLRILHHFGTNADDYSVIFTSGATSAMKLLAESFRFNGGLFIYLEESHTSVVGMRELVNCETEEKNFVTGQKQQKVYCLCKTTLEQLMDSTTREQEDKCGSQTLMSNGTGTGSETETGPQANSLMAFPAQCNFSGYKYPLEWISRIQQGNCLRSIEKINAESKPFTYLDKVPQPQPGPDLENQNQQEEENVKMARAVETKEIKSNLNVECCNGDNKWFVLLDAASFAATNVLDLSLYPADFIPISFYKMFGFPTGLGALLVRNESSHVLEKQYFGGGTVNIAIPSKSFHVKREKLHERFEDGTISFLSILALRHGFDALIKLGRSLDTISIRTFRLAQYFYKWLSSMKYLNGQPVACLYLDTKYDSPKTQGPIVTFNLLRSDGTIIGYSEMEQIAYLHNVHLRYGCFCNPGACRRHLNLHPDEVLKHFEAGHVCGDMTDLIDGKPTGAIRVSLGYMTTLKDVDNLLWIIHNCWILPFQVHQQVNPFNLRNNDGEENHRPDLLSFPQHKIRSEGRKLLRIFVYPIKSCAPFEVSKTWALGPRGLLYDREWLIMNSSGVPLTQKREPKLCQLKTRIDISNRRLVLSFKDFSDFYVPLEYGHHNTIIQKLELCNSKVCGDIVSGINCGEEVSEWLSTVLDRPSIKLIRMPPDFQRTPRNTLDEISLVNYSQCLLVSTGSLRRLAEELLDKGISVLSDNDEEGSKSVNSTHQPTPVSVQINRGTDEAVPQDGTTISSITRLGLLPKTNGNRIDPAGDTNLHITKTMENLMERFRPNFVISGSSAYEEETWEELRIGNILFKSGGPCQRCMTICMDQKTGHRSSEPLLTLSASRSKNFGIHLYIQPVHSQSIIPIEETKSSKSPPVKTVHIDNVLEVLKVKSQPREESEGNPRVYANNTHFNSETENSCGIFRKIIESID